MTYISDCTCTLTGRGIYNHAGLVVRLLAPDGGECHITVNSSIKDFESLQSKQDACSYLCVFLSSVRRSSHGPTLRVQRLAASLCCRRQIYQTGKSRIMWGRRPVPFACPPSRLNHVVSSPCQEHFPAEAFPWAVERHYSQEGELRRSRSGLALVALGRFHRSAKHKGWMWRAVRRE